MYGWRYETAIKPVTDPDTIPMALSSLRAGHVIVVPADDVYHLAADGLNPDAVARLVALRQGTAGEGLTLLLASVEDVWHVAASFPPGAFRLARAFWPGPVTLLLPARRGLPEGLLSDDAVAVRIPDFPWLRDLIGHLSRPLAVAPASTGARPPAWTTEEVLAQFRRKVPLVVDGGVLSGGPGLTVVDCRGQAPRVVQTGALSEQDIQEVWWKGEATGASGRNSPQPDPHAPHAAR